MNNEMRDALAKPFPSAKIKEKRGQGGRSMSYISHALVTERLNEVDPEWSWEPFATHVYQDAGGRMHCEGVEIKLTVGGVTRVEAGGPQRQDGFANELKNSYSDAIKRAAMRFGVALSMWDSLVDAQHDEDARPDLEAGEVSASSSRPTAQRPQSSPQSRPQQANRPASPDERETVTRTLLERAKRVGWSDRVLARWAQDKGFASLGAAPITSLRTLSNWFETHPDAARSVAQRTAAPAEVTDDEPDEDEAAATAFDLAMAQAERAEVGANGDDRFTR